MNISRVHAAIMESMRESYYESCMKCMNLERAMSKYRNFRTLLEVAGSVTYKTDTQRLQEMETHIINLAISKYKQIENDEIKKNINKKMRI